MREMIVGTVSFISFSAIPTLKFETQKNQTMLQKICFFSSLPSKTWLEADFLSIQRDYLYGQLLLCHRLNEILRLLRQIHRIRSQIWEIWEI